MTPPPNQTPEQRARDQIDQQLDWAGWLVQDKKAINFNV
jgi:type I site-specific restriction endonuclease